LDSEAAHAGLPGDSSLDTPIASATAEPLAPASFYAATPPREKSNDSHTTRMGPVAAIESPVGTDALVFAPSKRESAPAIAPKRGSPTSVPKRDEQSAAGGEPGSLTWKLFAGETLIAQVKTVLACIGVVAILIHGTRAIAPVSTNGTKASAKRGKK
jgi:hypothetical protein